jgi:hypothetical protein
MLKLEIESASDRGARADYGIYTVGKRNDEPEQHVGWVSLLFIVPDRSREKNIAKTESLLNGLK